MCFSLSISVSLEYFPLFCCPPMSFPLGANLMALCVFVFLCIFLDVCEFYYWTHKCWEGWMESKQARKGKRGFEFCFIFLLRKMFNILFPNCAHLLWALATCLIQRRLLKLKIRRTPCVYPAGLFKLFLMWEKLFFSSLTRILFCFFSFSRKFPLGVFHTSNMPKMVFHWYWQPHYKLSV